jgi:hypothetical protein
MAREGSDFSAGLRAVEPSIRVFPRPSGFKNDQFASVRSSIGGRTLRALARLHRGSDRGHPRGSPTVTKQWRWSGPGARRRAGCHRSR